MPVSGLWLTPDQPNSEVVVLPRMMAPASSRRGITGASTVGTWPFSEWVPRSVGDPGGLGQILDRDRQAEQRTRGVASRQRGLRSLRGVAGALGGECGEGVDAGLAGFDAGQHGVDQLDRREFLTPDQRCELGGGREAEIIGHRRLLGGRGRGRGSWRARALVSSRRGGHRGVRQALA